MHTHACPGSYSCVPMHIACACILAKLLSAAAELLWGRMQPLIAVSREVLASRICFVLLRTAADFVVSPPPGVHILCGLLLMISRHLHEPF